MQKKTIVGMILTTAVLTPPAVADALLFPVITRSPSVSTFISVVNTQPAPPGQLFVNYYDKPAGSFVTQCTDRGRRQLYSHGRQNDIVTWDASGNFNNPSNPGNGGPLFNDAASLAPYGAVNFKMGGTGAARGFLIVDDNANTGEFLYGEAFLMDITNGAAWGYRAYNSAGNNGLPPPGGPFFGGPADFLGEALDVATGTGNAAITVLPPSEWTTRFFVTPVNGGVSPNLQRDCANCSANVYISSDKAGTLAGLYDRDTTAQSTAFAPAPLPLSAKNIVCTDGPGLSDLLPMATLNSINNQGGWGYVQVRQGTSGIQVTGATVIKLEFNIAGTPPTTTNRISPDTTRTFSGIVNTAVWLRNFNNTNGTSGF